MDAAALPAATQRADLRVRRWIAAGMISAARAVGITIVIAITINNRTIHTHSLAVAGRTFTKEHDDATGKTSRFGIGGGSSGSTAGGGAGATAATAIAASPVATADTADAPAHE